AELGRDDLSERGLAQARRAGEQDVVEGLAPLPRRLDEHPEVLAQLGLADELVEALRAQRRLRIRRSRLGADQPLVHAPVVAETTLRITPELTAWPAPAGRCGSGPRAGRPRPARRRPWR